MSERRWLLCWGFTALCGLAALAGCQSRRDEPPVAPAAPPVASAAPESTEADEPASPAREPEATAGKEPAGDKAPPAKDAPPPAGWGILRGRFLFDGPAPAAKPLTITSDVEFCSMHHPQDESLLVRADNWGLANVVITLFRNRADASPPIHPSFMATAMGKVTLDNEKCRFRPHVVALRTSQTLEVVNSDEVAHNTKIDTLNNPPINPTLPAGGRLEHRFTVEERAPARVSCNIHPWMVAWVVVRPDPYFAVTDPSGAFTIANLPAGTWTFQVWHETARYVTRVQQNGKPTEWSRGRFTAEIKPDATTDLGEIRVDHGLFGAR